MACDAHASTPRLSNGRTPIELLSQVAVRPQVKHFHHFGCTPYVFDNNKLQSGGKIPRWSSNIDLTAKAKERVQMTKAIKILMRNKKLKEKQGNGNRIWRRVSSRKI